MIGLTPAELQKAWDLGEAANRTLDHSSAALRVEVAAYLIAAVLTELASRTRQPDDLDDVRPIGEELVLYVLARPSFAVTAEMIEKLQKDAEALTQAQLERAWGIGEAANRTLGYSSATLRAEVAAYLIAAAITKLGSPTGDRDDWPIDDQLLVYLMARARVIVAEAGSRQLEGQGISGRA